MDREYFADYLYAMFLIKLGEAKEALEIKDIIISLISEAERKARVETAKKIWNEAEYMSNSPMIKMCQNIIAENQPEV